MTNSEFKETLCVLISKSLENSAPQITEKVLKDLPNDTFEKICAKMISNAIETSVSLSVEFVFDTLLEFRLLDVEKLQARPELVDLMKNLKVLK